MSILNNTVLSQIVSTNLVISVGSVDGICTAAALLRLIGEGEVGVQFCQAFTVDKVDPSKWADGQKVAFVDLAVNNRDKSMTVDFIRRIREAGHEIVAVIDEHNKADWTEILGDEGIAYLAIKPESQKEDERFGSSGAVLSEALIEAGVECDMHTSALLEAADQADRGNFDTHFGKMVNEAVKSNIRDDARRVHIARHLAESQEPSSEMLGWVEEYQVILANHEKILGAAEDLGDGIFRASALGKIVDMTSLMFAFYRRGARVIALEGEFYVPAEKGKRVLIGFGTNDKSLDLLTAVKEAELDYTGGFAQKVNVELHHSDQAIGAIRQVLQG